MRCLFMLFLLLSGIACQTGVVPISQREYLHEKEGKSPSLGHRRPLEDKSESATEVFVKRENLTIVPKETKNFTGSLFSLKNPDNLLFIDPPRGEIGDALDIAVRVNRSDKAKTTAASESAAPAAPGASAAKTEKAVQDELLAALPKLEPGISDPKIPSTIKMQVVRKLENGDLLVEASRASQSEWEAHAIRAQARLPRGKVSGTQEITTADLAEVHWYESQNGQVVERESSLWEDEYTMRWSGFDEARSKAALDLENKRKDMQKVRDRLQDRIVNVGKERGQIAKERDRVSKLRQEAEDKLHDLAKKIEEKDSLIEQQKEAIKKNEQILESMQQANAEQAALTKPATNAAGKKDSEKTQ